MDRKNKILIVLISLLLVLLICLILFLFVFNKNDKIELNYNKSLSIEMGENIKTIDDYINSDIDKSDIKIIWDESLIVEDDKVNCYGTFKGYFEYKNKEYEIELVVVDKVNPTIDGVKDLTTIKGVSIDLLKNITISDNSKDTILVDIVGEYDINTVGTYKLKYVAKDNSGNTVEKEFTLSVVEEKKEEKKNIRTTTAKGYSIENKNGNYYIEGVLIANKTFSLSNSYNPGNLTDEFNNNFSILQSDAKNEGFNLKVISGFRSYSSQKSTYNGWVNKYGQAKADTLSARPGHSEHQTGLAADINSLNQSWGNTDEGKWLNNNCYKYGFIIRYPYGKDDITGYIYEPWHIRYVGKDLAEKLYNDGNWITLEEYFGIDSKY